MARHAAAFALGFWLAFRHGGEGTAIALAAAALLAALLPDEPRPPHRRWQRDGWATSEDLRR